MRRWFLLSTRASVRSDTRQHFLHAPITVLLRGIFWRYDIHKFCSTLFDLYEAIVINYCNVKGRWKQKQINQPKAWASFHLKFSFRVCQDSEGNWLKLPALQMEKVWLQKILAWVLSSFRAPEPTESGYNVPLVPPSRRPYAPGPGRHLLGVADWLLSQFLCLEAPDSWPKSSWKCGGGVSKSTKYFLQKLASNAGCETLLVFALK